MATRSDSHSIWASRADLEPDPCGGCTAPLRSARLILVRLDDGDEATLPDVCIECSTLEGWEYAE